MASHGLVAWKDWRAILFPRSADDGFFNSFRRGVVEVRHVISLSLSPADGAPVSEPCPFRRHAGLSSVGVCVCVYVCMYACRFFDHRGTVANISFDDIIASISEPHR